MSELELVEDALRVSDGTSLVDGIRNQIPGIENDIANMKGKFVSLDDIKTVNNDVIFELSNDAKANMTEVQNLTKSGDFDVLEKTDSFKTLFPDADNNPEIKTYMSDVKATFEESPAGQLKQLDIDAKAAADPYENLPIPQTTDELMEQVEKVSGPQAAEEMKGQVQEFNDAAEDLKNGDDKKAKSMYDKLSDTTKKIIKITAFLALIVFAGYEFTKFISGLAHKLSGCFAAGPSGICKIRELTCDNDDLTSDSTFCQACQKFDCSDLPSGTPGWVPLKAASCSCDPTKKADFPGQYCPDAPQSQNTCGGKNPACPIKPAAKMENYYGPVIQAGVVADCSQSISACPNASGCVSRAEACKGNNSHCSELCNNESLNLPASISVQCKVTSWWQALGHFAGDIIKPITDPLKNLLSGALKGLIWIALIIIGIIGAFFVVKELWAATGSSGKDSGNVSKK
jgi:hypothetical protein